MGSKGPTLIDRSDGMRYVPSLTTRTAQLIPHTDVPGEAKDGRSKRNVPVPGKGSTGDDPLAINPHPSSQSRQGRAPSLVFDAYTSSSNPTDPSGALGPNHYFVVFNTGFIIYDKSGNDLTGQLAVENIFSAGGCCDLTVSYDNAADRWVLSYLMGAGAGAEIAVSDGPNPITAGWYVYTLSAINDYQKLSVWSDGYYMTDNTTATNRIYALERDEMLLGSASIQIIGFPLPDIATSGFYSPQAFNVSNDDLPATGSLPIVYLQDDAWAGVSDDHIKLWEVDVDWVTPGNSTISDPPQEITTADFTSVFDNGSFSNLAQPQPGGGGSIDALQATIMNQAQFRRFTNHNSAVFNFVVDADGGSGELAAIRWMELRQDADGDPWSLYQQGTYTAPDGRHAWNASLIMDDDGNIGMGYTSMSGPSTPSTVRVSSYYTGRLAGDTPGSMTVAEQLIANGDGNFTTSTRYGDYSKIDVDPCNDKTFWFITEYISSQRKGVVGAFQIAPPEPEVRFTNNSTTVAEDPDLCFTDVAISLEIGAAATANTDLNFNIDMTSTATSGLDFELLNSNLTFPSGSTANQDLMVRVYHDGLVEADETVIIDFSLNANGGNASKNTCSLAHTLTITSSDTAPVTDQTITVFSDGFESYSDFAITPVGGWTMLDNDGDNSFGSNTYDFPNENYIGTFIIFNPSATTPSSTGTAFDTRTGSKGYYSFASTGNNSGTVQNDDYIFTPQISLSGTSSELRFWARSVTDAFGLDRFRVGISTTDTNPASFTFISSAPYEQAPIAWTEYVYDLSAYDGSDIYIAIQNVSADSFVLMLDDFSVTTFVTTAIQTAVNMPTADEIQLNGPGTVYTSDRISGNVMMDIANKDQTDYDCIDVYVSRSGSGAQAYAGSASPNLVTDKTFEISSSNGTNEGFLDISFYFTEAEVSGWEAATGLNRTDLVAARGSSSSAEETSALTIGSFGASGVTFTGSFTGANGTFYFGPLATFQCNGVLKTWDGTSWSPPGAPDLRNSVVIQGNYDTNSHGDIKACSVSIDPGSTLQVDAGGFMDVVGNITVNGSLIVEHQGSVVQRESGAIVTNNGTINVEITTPNLLRDDFMAVGSPMSAETVAGVFGGVRNVQYHTPENFIPNTPGPGVTNFSDDNGNFWRRYNSGSLTAGEGYLIFPQDNPSGTTDLTFSLGTLNSGDIVVDRTFNGAGVNPDGTPNIYANPYPSPISTSEFLSSNGLTNAYFWEHITAPSSIIPGPYARNYSMDDISIYNDISGGLAAASDGGGTTQPNGIISTAQGFGVLATSGGNVTFTNSMRRTTGNTTLRTQDLELDRMWFRVSSDAYDYPLGSNTLIAYNPEATDGLDTGDANRLDTSVSLYSQISGTNKALSIQSLEEFNEEDKISLGFSTLVEADLEYNIKLSEVQGTQIGDRSIYLIDNLLGRITDLTQDSYSFRSGAGDQPGRFTLQFEYEVLATAQNELESIGLYPNPTDGLLNIVSPQSPITRVTVTDLQGRQILQWAGKEHEQVTLDLTYLTEAVYLITVQTRTNQLNTKLIKQ
ncbi:T9SS-dependent choice-of-anchor J family protein [Aureitalea marina]|uniref:Secretion system C-terminal sorting domain-containing protein n=1 Tax=Aureitalea marina TaxID=930804 RepID=A0A2S7KM81_9FLAO|nr:choice-of-anchor J domain-containing protein [Aureitalea marina]PQB03736.1 hypothetical protein BST85_01570 [Aureitalea marina]